MNISMKFKATLKCKVCNETVLEQTFSSMNNVEMPKVTYSKTGTPKFMGRLLTANIDCPGCHMLVIKVKGLNTGIHGSISMNSVH